MGVRLSNPGDKITYIGNGWRGVRLSGGGGLAFLLRDDFTTPASAPLTSPRTAEPGPGTLTITDTENKLSIAGGALTFANGKASPAFGDPGVWGGARTRSAGLAMLTTININAKNLYVGWSTAQSSFVNETPLNFTSLLTLRVTGAATVVGDYAISTTYQVAFILRAAGNFILIKGGLFVSWTLLWIGSVDNTSTLYPGITNYDATFTANHLRVLDLAAPYSTDYGLATQRLSGARAAGNAFTHDADHIVEWTQTTRPSADFTDICVRYQDDNNTWAYDIDNTGAVTLYEVVAGVWISRVSNAAGVANGHRCVGVAAASAIRFYSNNVLRFTYSSASGGATRTAGKVLALGTGGAVSDLVSWPRTLSGSAVSLLDAAVA